MPDVQERVTALELQVFGVDPKSPGHALRLDRLESLIERQTAQVGWLVKGGGLLAVYKVLEVVIEYAKSKP
jgi:hypothetical protein